MQLDGQLIALSGMPIVTVELVADPDRPLEPGLTQLLADSVGSVLNSPSGQTWIRLRSCRRDEYAENNAPVAADELPVFVTLLQRKPPAGAQLRSEVAELTRVIAQVIGRPSSCVHIEYAPAAAGRMSFGGELVE